MENGTTIRLELGIDARHFIQQVQLHNRVIKERIQKGIELALEDIANEGMFIEHIRKATKDELEIIVHKSVISYEIRNKISKMVEEKIGEKIDQFADKIAEKVTDSLR